MAKQKVIFVTAQTVPQVAMTMTTVAVSVQLWGRQRPWNSLKLPSVQFIYNIQHLQLICSVLVSSDGCSTNYLWSDIYLSAISSTHIYHDQVKK